MIRRDRVLALTESIQADLAERLDERLDKHRATHEEWVAALHAAATAALFGTMILKGTDAYNEAMKAGGDVAMSQCRDLLKNPPGS